MGGPVANCRVTGSRKSVTDMGGAMKNSQRLSIDLAACSGHGRCYSLAPELVEPDEDGFPVTLHTSLDDPAGLERARRIVAACPEQAISLSDA